MEAGARGVRGRTDILQGTNWRGSLSQLVMKDKQRLRRFRYRYIIIDEGHRMKNATSKLSATLMQYEAEHRVLLTGLHCSHNTTLNYCQM